jgi:hypothetical protein
MAGQPCTLNTDCGLSICNNPGLCSGGANSLMACSTSAACPGGICQFESAFLDKNSARTHAMPVRRPATVASWIDNFGLDYAAIACCGANMPGADALPPHADPNSDACSAIDCSFGDEPPGPATKADFYTPWMLANNIVPDEAPVQLIEGPDGPANFKVKILDKCPAGINQGPGDKCYNLHWQDPTGTGFNAPANFYLVKLARDRNQPDWTPAEKAATTYCPAAPGFGVEPTEMIPF